MIECELCENYFHADDIETCPACYLELCPDCYEEHVIDCLASHNDNMNVYNYHKLSIPTKCPKCETTLEFDIHSDCSAILYCPDCDFTQDLDKELLEQIKQDYNDLSC